MQYAATTPTEYLDGLDVDWRREKLLQIREIILRVAPSLDETIHYKMLGYGTGENHVFHLNAQSGYVSLYVGNVSNIDPDLELLAGLNVGKGCIRFTKSKSVPESRIDEFISRAFDMWQAGDDVGC